MIYYSADCLTHNPRLEFNGEGMRTYPEQPDRIIKIVESLNSVNLDVLTPDEYSEEWIRRIHQDEYVDFIKSIPGDLAETAPTGFNYGGSLQPDSSWHAKLGNYFFDPATPIMGTTPNAAIAAVNSALSMCTALLDQKNDIVAALSRPPGHHAMSECGGGYCIFNNAAIAAEFMRSHNKSVSILDIDYHHGNGTQSIFYDRDDVQYVSIHADTRFNYPFYWGFKDQTGIDIGRGFNHNIPVSNLISESGYLKTLDEAINVINDYSPDFVILSMGFDTHVNDPIAGLSLQEMSYSKIGEKLTHFDKIGIVLEGGYSLQDIGPSFTNLYTSLQG